MNTVHMKTVRRLMFTESQKAKREKSEIEPIDTKSVVSSILETYKDCDENDILPVFVAALTIFRTYDDW